MDKAERDFRERLIKRRRRWEMVIVISAFMLLGAGIFVAFATMVALFSGNAEAVDIILVIGGGIVLVALIMEKTAKGKERAEYERFKALQAKYGETPTE